MTTFKELNLNSKIMKGLEDLDFVEPTPIQEKAIPFILESKEDLIALAQTGTGKTAAFGLPILNKIGKSEKELQAIILCPTRELCLQISNDLKKFAKYSKETSITAVYGGARIDIQVNALRKGTNIVVGTPGRVHDLIRRKVLKLQAIKWLVLDEADEMLDMGFKDDLDAILSETPETRQTLLFSATMSRNVSSIAKNYMKKAQEISSGEKNVGADKVAHEYYLVNSRDRFEALKRILDSIPGVYGILFCRTRRETQEVADKLKQAHYNTEAMHGDISQSMRTKIMDRFRQKRIQLLVATDVAARGIDVSDLSHIINYNLPDKNETYTHRSGRTGRAKKSGVSVSIITPREERTIRRLEDIVSKKFELKKVPTGEDIFHGQVDNFLKEIEEVDIKEPSDEEYYKKVTKKLEKIHKEDLIKHLIKYKFDYLIKTYRSARDLNAHVGSEPFDDRRGGRNSRNSRDSRDKKRSRLDENSVNLKINFGKRHGFDVKSLFSLINSNRSLKGVEIGKIDLGPEHSVFSVEKNSASRVMKQLEKSAFGGKKLNIRIDDNVDSGYSRRGRSGGGGNSGGRKRRRPGRKSNVNRNKFGTR